MVVRVFAGDTRCPTKRTLAENVPRPCRTPSGAWGRSQPHVAPRPHPNLDRDSR